VQLATPLGKKKEKHAYCLICCLTCVDRTAVVVLSRPSLWRAMSLSGSQRPAKRQKQLHNGREQSLLARYQAYDALRVARVKGFIDAEAGRKEQLVRAAKQRLVQRRHAKEDEDRKGRGGDAGGASAAASGNNSKEDEAARVQGTGWSGRVTRTEKVMYNRREGLTEQSPEHTTVCLFLLSPRTDRRQVYDALRAFGPIETIRYFEAEGPNALASCLCKFDARSWRSHDAAIKGLEGVLVDGAGV
jgi:hypothetical protein